MSLILEESLLSAGISDDVCVRGKSSTGLNSGASEGPVDLAALRLQFARFCEPLENTGSRRSSGDTASSGKDVREMFSGLHFGSGSTS